MTRYLRNPIITTEGLSSTFSRGVTPRECAAGPDPSISEKPMTLG